MTEPTGRGRRRHRDLVVDARAELDLLAAQYAGTLRLLDTGAVLRALPEQVRAAVGADVGFVGQRETDGAAVLRHLSGARTAALFELSVAPGRGLGGKAMTLLQPQWVTDYELADGITHHFDSVVRAEGLRAVLAVPLRVGPTLYGVAYAGVRAPASFSDLALDRLGTLGREAATSLHAAGQAEARTEIALLAERRRLAADLHDSLGAMLFSLGADVHDLRGQFPEGGALVDRLERIESQIDEATAALRTSLSALDRVAPEQALGATIAADCAAFAERTGTAARSFALDALPALDGHRSAVLVSTVREAMLNVEKHASAGSVVVTLTPRDGGVLVAVADDGAGLPGGGRVREGLGLASCRERLERLAGRLSVVGDDEGGGVTLRAWLPAP